jgi:hypothetical protein
VKTRTHTNSNAHPKTEAKSAEPSPAPPTTGGPMRRPRTAVRAGGIVTWNMSDSITFYGIDL